MKDVAKNTLKRVASAVVALPIYIYCIITDQFQAIPVLIASMAISLICLYEYYNITERADGGKPFIKAGMIAGCLVNIIMYLYAYGTIYGYSRYIDCSQSRVVLGAITLFVAVLHVLQLVKNKIKGSTYSLSVTLFGVVYIVLFFSHIMLLKSLANGVFYILILNIVVMLNDTGAYFGGVLFGKHKTKLVASPNKSWEGYFSGLITSVIAMIITNEVFATFFARNLFTMIEATFLGILLSVLANVGDLVESLFKRDGEIKDSGTLIPGHGGMWDVFDALIFSMPVFYYYLVLKGIP